MKKTNNACYIIALCVCFACNANSKENTAEQNSSNSTAENQGNNNTDAKVLRMQLSSIKDNQVTKGDAVLFLLPTLWQ